MGIFIFLIILKVKPYHYSDLGHFYYSMFDQEDYQSIQTPTIIMQHIHILHEECRMIIGGTILVIWQVYRVSHPLSKFG